MKTHTLTLLSGLTLAACSSPSAVPLDGGGDADAGTTPDGDAGMPPAEVPAVLTHHNNNARTGTNLAEAALSPKTVSKQTFGLAFSRAVEGYIYGQPLIVPKLAIGGKTRDAVFVATEHDDAYAFDAEDPAAAAPLWHVTFGPSIPSTDLDADQGTPYRDIIPELGVTSTPVIDLARKAIYIFAQTKENGAYLNKLHALDIATGAELANSPVEIAVSAPGTGAGSQNGVVTIPPKFVLQRPALAVDRGVLWVVGGGHGDFGPYHGWVLAFDQATMKLLGTYLTTPDGWAGGIWQAGNGPAIDEDGNVYFESANGTGWDPTTNPPNLPEAFLKVALSGGGAGLSLVNWFSPYDHQALDDGDSDLGSTGPILIPGTKLLVGGGKTGKVYVLERGNMGHNRTTDDSQILQSFQAVNGQLFAAPVYWNGPTGKRMYVLAAVNPVRAFRLIGNMFDPTPYMTSAWVPPDGVPGGALSLTANGSVPGTAILWALTQADSNQGGYVTGSAALHAFDADDLGRELWSSTDDPADAVGKYAKFTVPTIVGGRAFVPTADGALRVYALKK